MPVDIGPRIRVDGEAQYRQQIQQIIQTQKTLKAEMQATASAFDKNTSAQEKARAKAESLTKQIENQKNRVSELETMVQKSAEKYGEADTRTLKWKEALANANTELNRMQTELADLPTKADLLGEAFERAGEKLETIGGKVEQVGEKLTKTFTLPIVAGFTAGTKSSLKYEDAMAKVYTIADESIVPIKEMSDEILALSNASGRGASELAEAAYQALSASVSTEDAVGFVATAADLAKAGFLETAGAVDVLTTIINAYGYSAEDAKKIADQLVQTQNDGKTTVDQLAQSMGTIIPTASALNVPLEQLNASYALMTKQGINTNNATTALNGLFTELADSGSTAAEVLQDKTGKTFGQLMADGASLGDILGILSDSVDGDSEAFLNLWGNVRAGRGALALVNAGAEEFNEETARMEDATGNVASALETLDTNGAKARRALNQLLNVGIQIGDRFAPYVEKAATALSGLTEKWDALSPQQQDTIVKIGMIVAAVGPALSIVGKLTTGIGGLVTTIGTIIPVAAPVLAAIAPALPIIAGVGAAIAAVITVVKHWDEIVEYAGGVWERVTTSVSTYAEVARLQVTAAWDNMRSRVETIIENIKSKLDTFKSKMENVVSVVTGKIDAIKSRFDGLREKVTSVIDNIKSAFDFQWQLPHLSLPHISVSWEGVDSAFAKFFGVSAIPHLSVSWYKKAYGNPMMFTSPTVIPTAAGWKGFGDGGGGEIVIGRDMMYGMIRDAVAAGDTYGDINIVINGAPGQDVRELADLVADRINDKVMRRRAAFG